MARLIHQVEQHRSSIRGVEAMTLVSNHHFPRHAHNQFGFGMITSGAQRSWSGAGQVEASAGDVIFCNPGEMHDGIPLDGKVRRWRIVYFEPALINLAVEEELGGELELVRPVARDALLARSFARLFASLTDFPPPDSLCQEEDLICAVACILQKNSAKRPSYVIRPSPSIAKVLQRMNSASDQPVSLAELAELAGGAAFTFCAHLLAKSEPHLTLISFSAEYV